MIAKEGSDTLHIGKLGSIYNTLTLTESYRLFQRICILRNRLSLNNRTTVTQFVNFLLQSLHIVIQLCHLSLLIVHLGTQIVDFCIQSVNLSLIVSLLEGHVVTAVILVLEVISYARHEFERTLVDIIRRVRIVLRRTQIIRNSRHE